MKSMIKRIVVPTDLERRIRESTGVVWRVERELTDGWFNTAYRVVTAEGDSAVVKMCPAPDAPVLRYERGVMGTEAMFYRRVASLSGFPTPELLHEGPDFLLISELPGEPWKNAVRQLPEGEKGKLMRQVGGIVAALHSVECEPGRFGCPAPQAALLAGDWPTAFLAMVEAILEDAERWRSPLGLPHSDVRGLVKAGTRALEEVRRPSLVHFDLWPGNLFVDPGSVSGGAPPRVTGVIDHERAFWGDPVADLVALQICGDVGPGSGFLAGYLENGGRLEYTPSVVHRLALYRLYFSLVLVVECGPRGYGGDHLEWCRAQLDASVETLRVLGGA
ncbi:phosphotransferase family protein [Streptomyces sp. NPDC017936]|uniref:phosphotransferase family protein n=1 Tax=Streptomyces sp. NPDC017936 TaxID=3365016 RepID=UPI003796A591